jgi:hypothetical protein
MSAKSTLIAAAVMLAMAPLHAGAHMILKSPVPYGNPNNSPLEATGSDFPCKAVPYTVNTMNEWPVGSEQTLSFTGTAVHGGGSCQISVTTDKEPTKESKWKVIYSIEGGCPVEAAGNLDQNGPSTNNAFKYTVPAELPNGVMTMAWTWFNKIGNREMYMNCAPITVSGGSDDTAGFDALPDMAVANIGVGTSCGTTADSKDFTFENPGKYGTSVGTGPFVDLCSGKTTQASSFSGGSGSGGSGNTDTDPAPAPGNSSAANPPSAPTASPPVATPPSVSATESTFRTIKTVTAPMPPLPSKTDGVFAPGASSAIIPTASAVAPSAPLRPTGQAPAASVSPQPQPQPSATPSPKSPVAGSAGEACGTDGATVCSADGTKFGTCNFGKAIMRPVADGTTCKDGAIAKRGEKEYRHRNQRTAV